jgi:pre-mRNA cleavage complex 2 protein Pcf11
VSKADFAQNPWDSSIQTRLKALLDLQTILQSQELPPDQIALIRDQVTQLSQASQSAPKNQTPPVHIPPTPVAATSAPAQQTTLSSLLGPGALAALLARQSATPQPTPPSQPTAPIRSPQPGHQIPYQPPPPAASSSTSTQDPSSLLERLRAAGILQGAAVVTSSPTPTNALAGSLPLGYPPPPFVNTPPNPTRTPLADIPNDVVLKPASLKM